MMSMMTARKIPKRQQIDKSPRFRSEEKPDAKIQVLICSSCTTISFSREKSLFKSVKSNKPSHTSAPDATTDRRHA